MKKAQVIALAVTLATIVTVYLHPQKEISNIPAPVHKLFIDFVIKYEKTYSTPKEYTHRLQIFYQNLKEAKKLRERNDITHEVGITKFFDLTKEEFLTKYTGLKLSSSPRSTKGRIRNKSKTLENPDSVDWRKQGIVSPIKDEGPTCKSYWAMTAATCTESAYAQQQGKLVQFSAQQLIDCSRQFGNMGCKGGWMDWAYHYLEDRGIETEADYPYTGKDGACRADPSKYVLQISDWAYIYGAGYGKILEDCVAKRVVSAAVDATTFHSYTGGIIAAGTCGVDINHGVSIVGYKNGGSKNYWIVRNSWGKYWGLNGYAHLEKDINTEGPGTCGIRLKATYPDLKKQNK